MATACPRPIRSDVPPDAIVATLRKPGAEKDVGRARVAELHYGPYLF